MQWEVRAHLGFLRIPVQRGMDRDVLISRRQTCLTHRVEKGISELHRLSHSQEILVP